MFYTVLKDSTLPQEHFQALQFAESLVVALLSHYQHYHHVKHGEHGRPFDAFLQSPFPGR